MLRPERMSKISVTGSRGVMSTVIETIHELNLVHLSDYDGRWDGFENGDPIEGAEEASERLVTIRSLENALDIKPGQHAVAPVDEETIEERLPEARKRITALEDDIQAARERKRQLGDRIERLDPFAELGIDLDLFHGYEHLDVLVVRANERLVKEALEAADGIRGAETFSENDVVAIFAATTDDGTIQDALVGVEFSELELPDSDGDPAATVAELRNEREAVEAKLESLAADREALKHEYGGFLRAAERKLTIEVEQAEAPLWFATTEHAFVAEGWIPSERFETLESKLNDRVGDRVELDELYQASYDDHGSEEHGHESDGTTAATDGGESMTIDDEPPVVMDNPNIARPFELLTEMVNRPTYRELDPTLAVFLTFPLAFGFMIGDIGYGILYILMGWYLLKYDSPGYQAVGMIAAWCGGFTVIFGWLYDDTFGVHLLDYDIAAFEAMQVVGLGVLTKGIQSPDWLMTWILASLFFGWLHLNIGLVIRFVNELSHGWKAAILEGGSWLLAMNGALIWIFSHSEATSPIPNIDLGFDTDLTAASAKPAEFFGPESVIAHTGFEGFPEFLGILGIVAFFIGLVMVGIGEGVAGLAESPAWILGHFLSYLRVVAVLLGKGAMAFVVNLLVFGAYISEDTGYVVFNLPGSTAEIAAGGPVEEAFAGLWNIDPLVIPIAILVFVLGHIIVLLLGITAAGIQMLRLEYVEFFQKFFEGGGRAFDAFGPDPDPDLE